MKKTLLALALVGASTSAFADAWLYGGVSAGRADYNDNSDTPMGFHVGTGILPIIGVEGGYWKHGNFDNDSKTGYAELGSWYAALKRVSISVQSRFTQKVAYITTTLITKMA